MKDGVVFCLIFLFGFSFGSVVCLFVCLCVYVFMCLLVCLPFPFFFLFFVPSSHVVTKLELSLSRLSVRFSNSLAFSTLWFPSFASHLLITSGPNSPTPMFRLFPI